MPARSLPLRIVRAAAATLALGVLLAVLVFGNLVVVGRAGDARCDAEPGGTHAEGERFPPSLRCLSGAPGHEVVVDDATTYVRWVFAIATSASVGLFVLAALGVRRLLGLSGHDLQAWWRDFP